MHPTTLLTLLLLAWSTDALSNLHEELTHYEVGTISRRRLSKRSIDGESDSRRVYDLYLQTNASRYHMIVSPAHDVIHPEFRLIADNDDTGRSRDATTSVFDYDWQSDDVDNGLPMRGYLEGEPHSAVSVVFDGGNALHGVALLDNDTLVFEPMKRHDEKAPSDATLVYRESNWRRRDGFVTQSCRAIHAPDHILTPIADDILNETTRPKRQTTTFQKTRCSLKLVADYHFYKRIADKDLGRATRYLIALIDRVNLIYESTNFTSGGERWGFMVKNIVVKESFSDERNVKERWNSNVPKWNVSDLLENFSLDQGDKQYCLVHLFTAQPFSDGVLGLGYIAEPRLSQQRGVCSPPVFGTGGREIHYNTALSSLVNVVNESIITSEADIVTAHELGHNWGSSHDDDSTPECSPRVSEGGKYIMQNYSLAGFEPNNKKFSPCSVRAIRAVLESKSQLCFDKVQRTFCGNRRVEQDTLNGVNEECDAGLLTSDSDRCCTQKCTLKPGAKCSPVNSACCDANCQLTPSSICRYRNTNECYDDSYCDTNGTCPAPISLPDGTKCGNDGECRNGRCHTYCERSGLLPCVCNEPSQSCFHCCRADLNSSKCKPHGRPWKRLREGTPCIYGTCDKDGICKKYVVDYTTHLFNVLDDIRTSNFCGFMRRHLVGMIIIISLGVWIPCSLLVHFIDKRNHALLKQQGTDIEVVNATQFPYNHPAQRRTYFNTRANDYTRQSS